MDSIIAYIRVRYPDSKSFGQTCCLEASGGIVQVQWVVKIRGEKINVGLTVQLLEKEEREP